MMDANECKQILIFLPQNILKFELICFCGLYYFNEGHCFLVFLFAVPCTADTLSTCLKKALKSYSGQNQCAGVVYSDIEAKEKIGRLWIETEISFVIEVDVKNNSYSFNRTLFRDQLWEEERTKIIFYDSYELMCSLVPLQASDNEKNFLHFLLQSSKMIQENDALLPDAILLFEKNSVVFSLLPKVISSFQRLNIVSVHSKIRLAIEKCLKITSVGMQLCRRYSYLNTIFKDIQANKRISLRCGNLISAITVDAILGIALTLLIRHYIEPNQLLDVVMAHTSYVVNELQKLIYWLMGVPAGLKLNKPLNNALGHFFLYHIYLWKTYMAIIKPVFIFVMESFTLIGVFGVTFLLTLFNDLISLATIHIYCFYGYAARLYGLQAVGLTALWRLFWGKKWNPLRQRIDSYSYDVHQLFIGTLMFTVLVFLLPTVLLYYLVFTALRLSILIVQGIISKTVHILNVLPAFVIFLRSIGSSYVKGEIQFTLLANHKPGPVILSMKVIHVAYTSVIQMTTLKNEDEEHSLTWKHLASSLLWGRIVYPL